MNHYTKKRIDNEKLSRQIAMHRFERGQRRDILSMIWSWFSRVGNYLLTY